MFHKIINQKEHIFKVNISILPFYSIYPNCFIQNDKLYIYINIYVYRMTINNFLMHVLLLSAPYKGTQHLIHSHEAAGDIVQYNFGAANCV